MDIKFSVESGGFKVALQKSEASLGCVTLEIDAGGDGHLSFNPLQQGKSIRGLIEALEELEPKLELIQRVD